MAEQIVQYDSCGMPESPIIRKWREEGRVEGLARGREEGLSKGREEGLSKGREEERLALLLRQLTRRCGPLSAEMTAQVAALSATQMLDLAEELLDFTNRDALDQWLGAQR